MSMEFSSFLRRLFPTPMFKPERNQTCKYFCSYSDRLAQSSFPNLFLLVVKRERFKLSIKKIDYLSSLRLEKNE